MEIHQLSAIAADWLPFLVAAIGARADVIVRDCNLLNLRPAFALLNEQHYDVRYDRDERILKARLPASFRTPRLEPMVS